MIKYRYRRVIIFGDNYGVPALLKYINTDLVVGIVAAEIRPKFHCELKNIAKRLGVPCVIQPKSGGKGSLAKSFVDEISQVNPDLIICHSYSMRIPKDILSLVGEAAFNVHFSLLPFNRGPNPVQWAIIHGCKYTGVTLHAMDEGFDTGAIVAQQKVRVERYDTWVTLMDKLKEHADVLLSRCLDSILVGNYAMVEQDNSLATVNTRVPKEGLYIDFSRMSDEEIHNIIRAQVFPLRGVRVLGDPSEQVIDRILDQSEIVALRQNNGK